MTCRHLIDRAELTLYKDATGESTFTTPEAYDLLVGMWLCMTLSRQSCLDRSSRTWAQQEQGGATVQLFVIYSHIMRASLVARRCAQC